MRVAGEPFPHLLFEFVLSASGWRYAQVAFGETFEALVDGLQRALWALGGAPEIVRSDNLSAATHELRQSGGRVLTERFAAVLGYYGLRSTRIHPGASHENGVVEQAHERLKSVLTQALVVRGSRDFRSLAFGLPGTGKTHAACALGHWLIEAGHSVYFTPAYRLVQELLAAERDLALPRVLRKLDQFEVLILDDLGYVQQDPAEAEVLFTLLAERYERRSLVITSNLVFSQWDQIFRNPMATAAAIDRIVHHSVILEFDVPSYRTEAAQQRTREESAGAAASRPTSRPQDRSGRRSRTM